MVYVMDDDTGQTMGLDEFVSFVEENVDVYDLESIAYHVGALRSLANDREFVLKEFHNHLTGYWSRPIGGRSLPQSIVPARRDDFYVRANIWLPLSSGENVSRQEKNLYSYDVAHDHNYNFATVGYYGPGYETDLYEYNYDDVEGYVGEPVDLIDCGRHQLLPGRVMVYRAGKDVHIQHPPESPSISINLMCRADKSNSPQQYLFDVQRKCITKGAGDIVSMRLFLLDATRHFNNEETVQILSDFAAGHSCDRTRAYALNVLDELSPFEAERVRPQVGAQALALSKRQLANGSDVVERR